MRKSMKWLGAFISILVLLVILAVVCLITFVNPNRFKPLIAEQVMKYTGRQLTIDGDLSWSFFPCVGIKTGHVLLGNPTGFEQKIFAEVQHATLGVKLFPLLHKQIESSGIVLDGLKLNLIKDANGKANWQFQQALPTSTTVLVDSNRSGDIKTRAAGLMISGIEVSNAEINWIDIQKKQSVSIEKLRLRAKDINFLKPFLIESEFDFISKNPVLSGHVVFSSQSALSIDQQIFSFRDIVLAAQLHQGNKKFNWQITGDVIADLQQQTLQWTHFHGQMGNLVLTGKIGIVDLTTRPHATGHLQFQPFDLKALLQEMGQDTASLQVLKNMSGDVDFMAAANAVDVQGRFKIDAIEARQVKLSHIVVPVHYQIGVLELSPITADFYQGSLQSNAKVNLTGTLPQIAVQAKLLNVHAEPLLQDLGGNNQKLKLAGMANVELQVTTVGTDSTTIVKNLNGTGHVSLNQGVLQGIDIAYLVDNAYALVKHQVSTATNAQQTDFGTLTGNVVFRDGVMVNNDLVLNAPRFKMNGSGSIDLVNRKIDFHLQAMMMQSAADQSNLYGVPIPITITGNLTDPNVRLDTATLAKAVAEQQLKKVESQVESQMKNKMQGKTVEMLHSLLGH